STAAVGRSQRLLVAFPGERSDAAVVITPLIVAAAFTPIRIWLQAIVDRPLKDPPGRVKARRQFGDQALLCRDDGCNRPGLAPAGKGDPRSGGSRRGDPPDSRW
ncbi:MAG: hypothetical protein MUO23_01235, partial [Anaerolineales bacterium]|nr:hypothetical protein [Anaerolineales bacterium]